MWNDTDIPLAYLITFRCYGTWLHGDVRGSVDRHNNIYDRPRIGANLKWQNLSRKTAKHQPVILNTTQRSAVETAIKETCKIRQWSLIALNVRTNHVHSIVSAGDIKPEIVLNALKANATRTMRERRCWNYEHSPWAAKGSQRYLWNERSIEMAVDYVINGQGDELPKFE